MTFQKNEKISFNVPFFTGKEIYHIQNIIKNKCVVGGGSYSKKCQSFFEERYNFKKVLLTSSCTDALEMCAILSNIRQGDEVIVPSFTFPSTANAFLLRGAKIIFVDSCSNHPNVDIEKVLNAISDRTKVIVTVHYGGISSNLQVLYDVAKKRDIILIEDAAHSIDSYHLDIPLGSIGHLSTFSFHESKNIQSGEGGMLVVNDEEFFDRADIIWEKGTNKLLYRKGLIRKYEWVDLGSSFLPSELMAGFLYAQLENIDEIQKRRVEIWRSYYDNLLTLKSNELIHFPIFPKFSSNNAHIFYFFCKSKLERDNLIGFLAKRNIIVASHYLPLHLSPFYLKTNQRKSLPNCERYADTIVRLPLYVELKNEEVNKIIACIYDFYNEGIE